MSITDLEINILCQSTEKIIKKLLAFFVKYRYYVPKVNIRGNVDGSMFELFSGMLRITKTDAKKP